MSKLRASLHARVHSWIDSVGFRLNASETDNKSNVTTRHYFFETFNFIERLDSNAPEKAKFLCFDPYGEKMKVNSLLDLQSAFFENISQLK
ncbi:hypothetical protein [Mucilaginibacter sp. KACC 22063]|uniref:hypothetical protein n=1 Tax=Mucilaginibacter sp. KACC 22063 TaxID=3025666 RepID=UPI002365BF29|nr:hypothetical protein [Mucilaginibacter sp. KACC 22063]WDF55474.1 hypothetical protein PQ461_00180 [Mucilaginibacter sp. KACC 22063]